VRGGTVAIDASASSQFVSGLLLAGASFSDGLTVQHTGGALPNAVATQFGSHLEVRGSPPSGPANWAAPRSWSATTWTWSATSLAGRTPGPHRALRAATNDVAAQSR
jgi:hypothetical protein